mmetsp:Transcript_22388/g.35980  ORF Transcript_22388/g.35980 Transcript_22388/m.35980 type:complete len:375 (+) Transcript_22388:95-1219(+)|eukprot:jgi/Bigna1/51267/estExt_Genewise1.C_1280015
MSSIVRKLLFPLPDPPDYDDTTFPEDLIWVPQDEKKEKPMIPCIFLPHKGAKRMVIYCHGNGCDLGTIYEELLRYREYWQVHILAMEYPGYGLCKGEPGEKSINEAVFSVYDYITQQLRWPSLFIFFYGRSIGTGPVCKLVSTLQTQGTRVGGIILHCAYTSIRAVVSNAIGSVAAALITDRWQNIKEVQSIDCPMLLIHGQADTLIPFTHSELLYDKCKSQHKQLVIVAEATHNTFDEVEDIKKPIEKFIKRAAMLMQKTLKHYADARKKKPTRNKQKKSSQRNSRIEDSKNIFAGSSKEVLLDSPKYAPKVMRRNPEESNTLFQEPRHLEKNSGRNGHKKKLHKQGKKKSAPRDTSRNSFTCQSSSFSVNSK